MQFRTIFLLISLLFVLGRVSAQLSDGDLVYRFTTGSLTAGTNLSLWTNEISGSGRGDLVGTTNPPTVLAACGTTTTKGVYFNGASSLTAQLSSTLKIDDDETVVILLVSENVQNVGGRQGIFTTTSTSAAPTESDIGPGVFVEGAQYYEDAENSEPSLNVAGTSGLTASEVVALGVVYQPSASETSDDYIVINGAVISYNEGSSADVNLRVAQLTVGARLVGADSIQYFKGCLFYLSVYIVSDPVNAADVALTLASLVSEFSTGASTPGNETSIPSPSKMTTTGTTGKRATTGSRATTGKRATTAATTGKKRGTTEVGPASTVAPTFQAVFIAIVSFVMFFMW